MKVKLILLLVIIIVLSGCTSGDGSNETEEIKEKINEEMGFSPYIPITDFPIGSVVIEYNYKLEDGERVRTHPESAIISYLKSKKEPLSKEERERWEDEQEFKKLIHGNFYWGTGIQAIDITIFKDERISLVHGELIDIDGHEVEYHFTKGKKSYPSKVTMVIEFENVSYLIVYTIHEGKSEEDAKLLAKEIINNY